MIRSAKSYLEEVRATPRLIKRQRLLQLASNDLPPGALTTLYLQLKDIGGKALCKCAPEYRYMTGRARRRSAKNPQLVRLPPVASGQVYQTTGVPPAQKTLYILFSGKDGGFFLPLSVLLQILPKGPKDVLVIRAGLERYYRDGVTGYGISPFEVSRALSTRFNVAGYRRCAVMGFSAGGIFTHRIAALLGANLGLSFAAIYTTDAFHLGGVASLTLTGFDPICACMPTPKGRMINVVASKNEFDVLASLRLKATRPKLMQVHLVNTTRHNVLLQMRRTRTLTPFLWLALAGQGAPIWLVSMLTTAFGGFVRGFRRLLGVQKVAKWYLETSLIAPRDREN